jgi:hypothetical protein
LDLALEALDEGIFDRLAGFDGVKIDTSASRPEEHP